MQGGRDLYPGCALQEDGQPRENWSLESSRLCLPELCAQAGSVSSQRKRHDFLIQTKALSGLALALPPLHSSEAFSLGYLIGCSQQPQAAWQRMSKLVHRNSVTCSG